MHWPNDERPLLGRISMAQMNRRRFLGTAMAGSAASLAYGGLVGNAFAQTRLSAVEWGGDVVKAMRAIAAKQSADQIDWTLLQGGAASILPRIKASWPRPEFDYVAGWEGSFQTMIEEDWLETITPTQVPNIADIPAQLILKNAKGEWKAVPRAVGGIYFGYVADASPMPIKSLDDLFDPKLKGLICWPGPTQCMMLQIVALAIHGGGSEHNMEPGWKLMKKLAQSGNIGRVATTDAEFTTSLSSGETAVGCFAEPAWASVAKNRKLVRLTKQAGIPTFLYQSGFGLLKNRPNAEATKKFVNFAISPEMNTLYASIAGEAPLNKKAKTPDNLRHLTFTAQEMDRFVHVPDFKLVLAQQDAWSKRWETEIAPLL
jgi:putative spermidine/putrescine transport system substrate-binding protein